MALGEKIPKGYGKYNIQKFTPEAMELYKSLFQHLGPESYLAKLAGGDQGMFEEQEAPALRQFNEMLGNIGSKFSGMGAGARRSSGFQNEATGAASDFAQNLQANRMQKRMDALKELMSFSQMLMGQSPYETGLVQKDQGPSGWGSLLGAGLGAAGGGYFGGTGGAYQGAKLGYKVGSAF